MLAFLGIQCLLPKHLENRTNKLIAINSNCRVNQEANEQEHSIHVIMCRFLQYFTADNFCCCFVQDFFMQFTNFIWSV